MYLNKAIDGYDMVGIFDGNVYNAEKLTRFGYISLKSNDSFLDVIKGHEFHYWDCEVLEEEWVMRAKKPVGNRSWPCIRIKNQVMAGFPHLFYPSCPAFAVRFAKACVRYKRKRDEAEE